MVLLTLVFKLRKNEDGYMKCKYCDKDIPDNSVFCTFCGKAITDNTNQKIELQNTPSQSLDSTSPKKNKRKLFIPIIIILLVIAGFAWLVISGMFCKAPIPYFNRTFAKYISDYHNLYIGMPYDAVIKRMGDSIVDIVGDSNNCTIYTLDRISIEGYSPKVESVSIENGKIDAVYFWFYSDNPKQEKINVENHYKKLFNYYSDEVYNIHRSWFLSINSYNDPDGFDLQFCEGMK